MMSKKQRLLVVSPTPFLPSDAGNRIRIGNLIAALRDGGMDVHFLHVRREQGNTEAMASFLGDGRFRTLTYLKPARPGGLPGKLWRRLRGLVDGDARHLLGLDEWYDPAITSAVLDWHQEAGFSAVMVEYVFFSALFEHLPPGVLKILDTHDRFSLRHRLYLEQGMAPRFFSTSERDEGRGFSRADVVLAIQEKEREVFARMTPRQVITVGHPVRVEDCSAAAPTAPGPRLLMVGSDNEINTDGLRRFLDEDWPAITAALPGSRLLVAGGLSRHAPSRDDVVALGFVDDIADAYRQAHLVVNPVRSGTGLNIKSIEALGLGMPLVATASGSRGLEAVAGKAFLQADTPEATAEAVRRIWESADFRQALAQEAMAFAQAWNQEALGGLRQALGTGANILAAAP